MKKGWLILACVVAGIAVMACAIPVTNNILADTDENALLGIPLPADATLVDSLSAAGKLTGNGNGMQYFGGILIKSDKTLEEVTDHYAAYRTGDFDCLVFPQASATVEVIEHGDYAFDTYPTDGTAYLVYRWGSHPCPVLNWDLRGH